MLRYRLLQRLTPSWNGSAPSRLCSPLTSTVGTWWCPTRTICPNTRWGTACCPQHRMIRWTGSLKQVAFRADKCGLKSLQSQERVNFIKNKRRKKQHTFALVLFYEQWLQKITIRTMKVDLLCKLPPKNWLFCIICWCMWQFCWNIPVFSMSDFLQS